MEFLQTKEQVAERDWVFDWHINMSHTGGASERTGELYAEPAVLRSRSSRAGTRIRQDVCGWEVVVTVHSLNSLMG